jgi:hypothetical protein
MKRIFVACTLVIGLSALGATNASATCVQLTNFCDQMQVDVDASGNTYGYWDWQCACSPLAAVLGNKQPGEVVVAGLLVELGLTESWRIHPSSSTVDIWLYDGVNPPSLLVPAGQPFTKTPGSCACLTDAGNKPSVNAAAGIP